VLGVVAHANAQYHSTLKAEATVAPTNAAEVAAKKENFHKHKVEKHETPRPWCKSLDFSK